MPRGLSYDDCKYETLQALYGQSVRHRKKILWRGPHCFDDTQCTTSRWLVCLLTTLSHSARISTLTGRCCPWMHNHVKACIFQMKTQMKTNKTVPRYSRCSHSLSGSGEVLDAALSLATLDRNAALTQDPLQHTQQFAPLPPLKIDLASNPPASPLASKYNCTTLSAKSPNNVTP